MRLIQVTIAVTGTRQQISPNLNGVNQSNQVYASLLIIQNNGANNMRIGDNTVSSTKGIVLYPSGDQLQPTRSLCAERCWRVVYRRDRRRHGRHSL